MYTILVADDQEQICVGISKLIASVFPQLRLLGSCNCGRDILEILKTDIPDILITDIRMPDISGLDVCKAIRERSQRTKIILISGYKEFEYARQALNFGVAAYLLKPYAPRELVNILTDALELLEKEDAASSALTAKTHSVSGGDYIGDMAQAIIEYIDQNYHNPDLSLTMIAQHFNLNYTYASEIFRSQADVSINDYINNLRIARAKEIIRDNPAATMESIARSVGFSSSTYFGKIFKAKCGQTPSQYKRRLNAL